jgi:hypothetical protein
VERLSNRFPGHRDGDDASQGGRDHEEKLLAESQVAALEESKAMRESVSEQIRGPML